jgi:protein gp37
MVFLVDLGDLFHSNVPDGFITAAIDELGKRQDVVWQVLTKRAERMASLLRDVPENVWIGATAENQEMAERRLPHLLKVGAAVRFLSVEPMLEPMQLDLSGISWVICGGESGPGRRQFESAWAVSLHQQCQAADVPFFFKQGSHRYPGQEDLLDGKTVKQWPR